MLSLRLPSPALVKDLAKLHTNKYRTTNILVEGVRSIVDITTTYTYPTLHPSTLIAYTDLLDNDLSKVIGPETTVYELERGDRKSDQISKKLSDTATPAGAFAVYPLPSTRPLSLMPTDSSSSSSSPFFLICDGVADPGNLGTLTRSYLAAGLTGGLLMLPNSIDPFNSKVVRASTGIVGFGVSVKRVSGVDQLIADLDALFSGKWRLGVATMDDDAAKTLSMPYYAAELKTMQGLVLGNEANGVSGEVLDRLRSGDDRFVPLHVPMKNGVESLNVGVVGSLMMFERLKPLTLV